jgi:hypothetical protein
VKFGLLLPELSKENLDGVKDQAQLFRYHTGVDLIIVVQKQHDLMMKLFQNKDIDFMLTGLPQVLAMQKLGMSHKVVLKSQQFALSDKFLVLLTKKLEKPGLEDPFFGTSIAGSFSGFKELLYNKTMEGHPIWSNENISIPKRMVTHELGFATEPLQKIWGSSDAPILMEFARFPVTSFGKIQSTQDIPSIEKRCKCKVVKMSPPIPSHFLVVRSDFLQEHPLLTYKVMEFFLTSDPGNLRFFKDLFQIDRFCIATSNATSGFGFLSAKFSFPQLLSLDL